MNPRKRLWQTIRKPLAAILGITIGASCAILATEKGLLTLDPSSVIFVTVLLVDITTSESLYVTAILRITGTILGLSAGAGVSFISNALFGSDVASWGVHSFQLACMAVLVFFPLLIAQEYRRYSYISTIFIYTVSALIFSGTTNSQTIATITTVIGGAVIATVVMRIFHYESAEVTLLRDHRQLLAHVMTLVRISVRANPSYKQDYFTILEETKSSFALNIDNIQNYERWMRWTRQEITIRFDALAEGLRPLYHEAASLYWSLTRDRVLRLEDGSASDPRHLYCRTSEDYFDNFHGIVTQIVDSVDEMQMKLDKVFRAHHEHFIRRLTKWKWTRSKSDPDADSSVSSHLSKILNEDASNFFKCLSRFKAQYFILKASIFPNISQQWLVSDYIYQLSVLLIELIEYLQVVIEILVPSVKDRRILSRLVKLLMIRVESMNKDGYLQAECSYDTVGNVDPEPMHTQPLSFQLEDDDSIESNRSGSRFFDI